MVKTRFKKIPQPYDGNCFFHSIAYLLFYFKIANTNHETVRKKVSNYYFKKNDFSNAKRISKLSEWATDYEVIATSHIYKVRIKVWEGKNNMWVTFGSYKPVIYIYNKENIHFEPLIKIND